LGRKNCGKAGGIENQACHAGRQCGGVGGSSPRPHSQRVPASLDDCVRAPQACGTEEREATHRGDPGKISDAQHNRYHVCGISSRPVLAQPSYLCSVACGPRLRPIRLLSFLNQGKKDRSAIDLFRVIESEGRKRDAICHQCCILCCSYQDWHVSLLREMI